MAKGVTVKPFFTAILPMSMLIFQELGHEQQGLHIKSASNKPRCKTQAWPLEKNGELTFEFFSVVPFDSTKGDFIFNLHQLF